MIRRILSYMGPYKKYAFGAILCVVTEAMFELIIPLIMADIVDVGVAMGDRAYIFQRGALMTVCAGAALLLGVGSARFSALCGQGLGAELRKAEYRRMQGFSFGNIDRFSTPSLVTRLTSDVTTIQNSVSNGIRPAFRAPTMMLTATIVSFTINAKLALVFLVAMPLLGVLLFEIIRRVRPLYTLMQSSIDQVNRIIQENLTAIRVVKAYVRGDYEIEKFSAGNRALQTASEKAFGLSALNMPAMQLVMYATILAILWFGGGMVRIGGMQVGELTGFLSYVLQVLNSLMMISNVFMMLTRSLASGRRILEIIDETPEITDRGASPDCAVSRGEITFDHVWFKYRPQAAEFVLSDISFTVGAGQTVGIIGKTGSAKTTLHGARCASTAALSKATRCATCAMRSPSCFRKTRCSAARCATICGGEGRTPRTRRSPRRAASPARMNSSGGSRTAMTPSLGRGASMSRAGKNSGYASRGRFSSGQRC